MVIGVDFGTSRSGYAYAWTGVTRREIASRNLWPGQPGTAPYPKAPTQSLYGPDNKIVAWGYEALNQLAQMRSEDSAYGFCLVDRFKMDLREAKEFSVQGPIKQMKERLGGVPRKFAVVELISDYLCKVKDLALSDLSSSTHGHLKPDEILWCLTVPAIWTDAEKQLMRLAAQKAGLIGTNDSEQERLILALEPEAAAIYCQQKKNIPLAAGTRFMVVDCGGGTVDITVHEVVGHGLREIAEGAGGNHGSTYVDRSFLSYLEKKLSREALADFRRSHPLEYLELLKNWEDIKCGFDPAKRRGVTYFHLPASLYKLLSRSYPEIIQRLELEQRDDDKIHLTHNTIEEIFRPVLDGLIKEVEIAFANMAKRVKSTQCDYLFLVGGFSESLLLRERIQSVFGSRVKKIVTPDNPGAAVVEGSVSFGLNPGALRSRLARLTYGSSSLDDFLPGVDPISKRKWYEDLNRWQCEDRFKIFVQRGDEIDVDQEVSRTFVPAHRKQTNAEIRIFGTKKRDVRYTDEPEVEELGKMVVQMPDLTGDMKREVVVTMHFGETELRVSAKDQTSGNRNSVTTDFLSTFFPEHIGVK